MGQMPDEDGIAAIVIADLLTSTLTAAYERKPPRVCLYYWERMSLEWLIRFKARRPRAPINAWIARFIEVNEAEILHPEGTISFNLREALDHGKKA